MSQSKDKKTGHGIVVFEYKGVQIPVEKFTGESRDKVELLTAELKKQIDSRIYNEKAKDLLWNYIRDEDIMEILESLDNL